MGEYLDLLVAYFRQQARLDVPPYYISDSFSLSDVLNEKPSREERASVGGKIATPARKQPLSASMLSGVKPLPANKVARPGKSDAAPPSYPQSEKRAKLAALFHETKMCQKCLLGKSRKSFVFGTGNPNALFMIIGEAPGEEEDRQGLPFVGAAGNLLTKMLTAINIDGAKQSFISNVIKCRPPENRNPEPGEILGCSELLAKQIEIIAPKVLLLLGGVAAHALLDSKDGVAALRERNGFHFYKNIPAFVTYHPAALLHNDNYRRPTWEDLQKLQKVLKDAGVYDFSA